MPSDQTAKCLFTLCNDACGEPKPKHACDHFLRSANVLHLPKTNKQVIRGFSEQYFSKLQVSGFTKLMHCCFDILSWVLMNCLFQPIQSSVIIYKTHSDLFIHANKHPSYIEYILVHLAVSCFHCIVPQCKYVNAVVTLCVNKSEISTWMCYCHIEYNIHIN